MADESQADGIILLCDLEGILQHVEHDELGLTDSHSTGRPFTALVHGDSLKTAFGFLEAVRSGEPAFGYGLYMRGGDDKILLHVNGYALDKQIIITGARSRVIGSQLYHRTLQSHHAQVNAVHAALAEERSRHAAREIELLEQVARLQADAGALSAELAQGYGAQAGDPGATRDQAQHVVELTLANARLQSELAAHAAVDDSRQQTENRFAGIFRAGPVGMAVAARSDGRLLHVNEQLERMLDYKPGELAGQPMHKLLAQGSRSVLGKVEAHLSVPHAPLEIATKFRMKDGSSRDLLAAFELAELSGELFLITAVMQAQERVQSEQAAQEHEQQRRELSVQSTALRQEVKLLHEDVRAFKLREQSLVDQATALREKIRTLEGEVALREQRERLLSANIAAYQPEARERTLNSQIGALQEANRELTSQVTALQEQMAKAEALAAEQKEREATLVNQVSAVQRLNFRIEALHGAMEESLKHQLTEVQQQQSALEAELTRRRRSEDELSHLAANLLESAANHEMEVAGFRQREETLVGQLTEMRAEALLQEKEIAAQIESLKQESATLQAELSRVQAAPSAAAAQPASAEGVPAAEFAQTPATSAAPPTRAAEDATVQHAQIVALRRQVGQLKAELNRRELAQRGQATLTQERAELLDRQIRERREAERALLSRIKEWRERAQPATTRRGMEREQALLEQVDRLEQHIKASVEAGLQLGGAAVALRAAQMPDSAAAAPDSATVAQTEQELRKELGALHRREQEQIRHVATLQAQLGLRELELIEHQAAANAGAKTYNFVSAAPPSEPIAAPAAEPPQPEVQPIAAAAVAVAEPAQPLDEAVHPAAGLDERHAHVIIASVASAEPAESLPAPAIAAAEPPALSVEPAVVIVPAVTAQSVETLTTIPPLVLAPTAATAEAAPGAVDAPVRVAAEAPAVHQLVYAPAPDLAAQNAIASLVLDSADLPSMLSLLAAEFGHQIHAEGSYLLLWDETRQQMTPGAGYGLYAGPDAAVPFAQSELTMQETSLAMSHGLSAPPAQPVGDEQSSQGEYSTLSLPLSAAGERIGVALLTFDQTHHFTPGEIERGERFAQQVAAAIAHAQRRLGTQRRVELLTVAQRAGRRLHSVRTRFALAAEMRALLAETFHYHYAEVLLMETGTGELSTLLVEPGVPAAGLSGRELARRDIRTQVIRTAMSTRLSEVRDGPLRDQSVLCVPLSLDGQTAGVLYLEGPKESAFGEPDQQKLESIAGALGAAVSNARAFELLEQQHRQLRTLTMQLAGGEDNARRQMARQLQMDVGQSLMMLSIALDNLPAESASAGLPLIKAKVSGAQQQVDDIARNVREVIAELHPPALDELGLAGALRYYSGRFSERTGVPAIVNSDTWKRRAPEVEAVLFRIAQETLTHVDRLDPIKPIRITLDQSGSTASLSIAGAGVGASASGEQELIALQERAAAIGGEVRVETAAGRESRLIVELAGADPQP